MVGFAAVDGGFFPRWWGLGTIALASATAASLLLARRLILPRRALLLVGSLAALAAFSGLSSLWTESVPLTALETERALLYLVAGAAAVVLGRERPGALLVGVAAGATVVAAWNLAYRIGEAGERIDLGKRGILAHPIGYENALGALTAIGIVLVLGLRPAPALRAAAVVPLAAALASTGNRGAVLALVAGLLVLAAFDPDALRAPAALAVALAAAGLALWSPTLDHDVSPARAEAGAVPLALGLLALALAGAALVRFAPGLERVLPRVRPGRRAAAVTLAAAVGAAIVGLVAAGAQRHEYWRAAVEQGAEAPIAGAGAGSFARHWLAVRDVPFDARDAHSLYVESFGELGLVGLALVVLVFVPPLALARRAPAAAAGLSVFLVHAGFDWDWEMPVLVLAALACAAVLASWGPVIVTVGSGVRIAGAAAGIALAALALPPFVGHAEMAAANEAFRAGEAARALTAARRAERLLPWSAEPYLLAAAVDQQRGFLDESRLELFRALAHDGTDPRIWRLLATATEGRERAEALERAAKLDPLGAPPRF